MKKRLPKFKSDNELEKFLENDISDYIHEGNFKLASFEFAPKDKSINIRLPKSLLGAVKAASKKKGVPYQRYIREALEVRVKRDGTHG